MSTFPPQRVLVAVDFGEASAQAVRVAGALAARLEAPLVAVHAESLEAPPYFTADQIEALGRQQVEARARAARYLATFAGRLTPVAVDPKVTDGPAAQAVLDVTAPGDLIVMGTHGRRGPSRWWLGSVAERVVRGAAVPVLVVRAGDPGDVGELFRKLLVVAESDSASGATDAWAAGLAAAFDGRIADRLSRCNEEIALRREATLLVVAGAAETAGWFHEHAERLLRTCALPMLFVPEEAGT